jgi:hypothetical protein
MQINREFESHSLRLKEAPSRNRGGFFVLCKIPPKNTSLDVPGYSLFQTESTEKYYFSL